MKSYNLHDVSETTAFRRLRSAIQNYRHGHWSLCFRYYCTPGHSCETITAYLKCAITNRMAQHGYAWLLRDDQTAFIFVPRGPAAPRGDEYVTVIFERIAIPPEPPK